MSKRTRLQTTLAGETPDRVPVALWRHFPVDDQSAADLAAATVEWQQHFDFDLVKVTPASSFCLKDWGANDAWRGNPEGTRDYIHRVITRPDDWATLQPLDPHAGYLGQQLEALRLIRAALPSDTPVIQTIFSPLAQARNLVGADHLPVHARLYPEALRAGLATITETTQRFVAECRALGVDGIFYAMQFASARVFSEAEYRTLAEPTDRAVLQTAEGLWLNLGHLHGEDVYFELISSYGLPILNWHDRETFPTLAVGLNRYPGVVCGGLRQWETLVRGTPAQVRAEARDAIEQTGGKRFILGTGCVTPTTAPRANLQAARDAVV